MTLADCLKLLSAKLSSQEMTNFRISMRNNIKSGGIKNGAKIAAKEQLGTIAKETKKVISFAHEHQDKLKQGVLQTKDQLTSIWDEAHKPEVKKEIKQIKEKRKLTPAEQIEVQKKVTDIAIKGRLEKLDAENKTILKQIDNLEIQRKRFIKQELSTKAIDTKIKKLITEQEYIDSQRAEILIEQKEKLDLTKEKIIITPKKLKTTILREKIANIRRGIREGQVKGREKLKEYIKNTRHRRQKVEAIKDYFKLTPKEFNRVMRGRDVRLMDDRQFKGFMEGLENQAAIINEHRQLVNQLKFTIQSKELIKTENLQKAMRLPTIEKMSSDQLIMFNEVLEQYKIGDEFLSVRKLETVDRTDLKGIKTLREARERLAKELGVSLKDVINIKVTELDRYRFDTALAEKNAFYKMMVDETNKALLNAEARFLEVETESNRLITIARKSKKRGIVERFIPTDKLIFKYLESNDKIKAEIAKNMTSEEIEAAEYIREQYAEMRDYLVSFEVLKKYRSDYITHIRRGFLETWKDDGLLKAFKETFAKYKLEEAKFNILDSQTGNILPLEKFFQYSMRRTGMIEPTKNVAKAFTAYLQSFEKKRALDSVVPKLDIYTYSLTPKVKTPRGLDFDCSLKNFVNEWINTKKGRTAGIVGIKQGGKIDIALRAGKMFTVLHDLALNIPVGLSARGGETSMNYIMLGGRKQVLGNIRKHSAKGKRILEKYKNFTGKTAWDSISEASKDIGDKFSEGLFFLFRDASASANKTFLLGSLSPKEWQSETLSIERLAELKREMGRYRVVEGAESVVGKTSIGKIWTQYKTWAIPPMRTSIKNITDIIKGLKSGTIKRNSRNFAEIFRSIMVVAAVGLAGGAIIKDEDDKSFTGMLIKKAYRDAMSIIGAFDPTIYSGVRLLDFLEDLAKGLKQIVFLERYKTTDKLKGVTTLKRTLTPQVIRQITPSEKKKKKSEGNTRIHN